MTLKIALPPDTETKLRERARSLGRDVAQYAADLIRQGVTAPTFDELLAPVRQDFARSDGKREFAHRGQPALACRKGNIEVPN